ncbi:hypothetical protein V8D89_015388 [Ganoderma adspersum]
MSSSGDPTVTQAELVALVVSNHCANAATTLIIFESLITIGQEVKYFWSGKATGAAILFYLNRYLTLVSFVDTMFGYLRPNSDKRCSAMVQADYVLEMITYIPWAAFSAMRAFALCRKWSLSLFILCLSLVPVAVNLANFRYGLLGVIVPSVGCKSEILTPSAVTRRGSLILSDCLLIVITWYGVNRPRKLQLQKNTFAAVLLRDGVVYFISLLLMNALHLILTMLSQSDIPSFQNSSFVAVFLEPLTTILVSRFLLHLQSVNHKALNHTSASSTHTTIVFSGRVLGSLDQSLSAEDFFGEDPGDGEAEDN